MSNKKIKIIVGIAIFLLLWCGYSSEIVSVDANAEEIVSSKLINIDSTTLEIMVVEPDEIQRLENNRSAEISQLKNKISRLELRVTRLEKEINP